MREECVSASWCDRRNDKNDKELVYPFEVKLQKTRTRDGFVKGVHGGVV